MMKRRIASADFFKNAQQQVNIQIAESEEKDEIQDGSKANKFCLQVFGISTTTTEDRLKEIFSTYGNLLSLKICSDSHSGGPAYALIDFADALSAVTAMKNLDGQNVLGDQPFQ